jgi:hypothetical protein
MIVMTDLLSANEWRGIVPLRSTRADVERVLGSPTTPRGSGYETENERVTVSYSNGPCERGVPEAWNVQRDTVISLTVYPKATLIITSLQLDRTKYRRARDPHVGTIVYYINEEDGIRIEASALEGEIEEVRSITYMPPARDSHLRCPGSSVPSDENVPPPRKFDEYSNIPFSDERARLDNFAFYVQQEQETIGYIIAYAGRRARAGEARARAERAKNYLVNKRGINAERIVTIDGGHREELMVELYLVPRGMAGPSATPTVDPSEVQIIRGGNARNSNRRSSRRPRRQ